MHLRLNAIIDDGRCQSIPDFPEFARWVNVRFRHKSQRRGKGGCGRRCCVVRGTTSVVLQIRKQMSQRTEWLIPKGEVNK
jgi:hypothetical protein